MFNLLPVRSFLMLSSPPGFNSSQFTLNQNDQPPMPALLGLQAGDGSPSALPQVRRTTPESLADCCTTCVSSCASRRFPACDAGSNFPAPNTILFPTVYAWAPISLADCSAAGSECTRT